MERKERRGEERRREREEGVMEREREGHEEDEGRIGRKNISEVPGQDFPRMSRVAASERDRERERERER